MIEVFSVIFVSALPFSELRGGIPLAIAIGFDPLTAFILGVIGNIIPVPILLLFLNELKNFFCRYRIIEKIYKKIENHVIKRKNFIEKYGYLGLTFFVALPLPITGAWTGCLLAFLLKLDYKKSFFHIFAGIIIAGIIVLLTTLGVITIFS
ncbi:MAG TPA: ligand-binding protein SH3 [Nanoarchaeota archaeon]|nr:ligand-binding protein SH3 [Nanoarchaeota archaeon]